MKKIIPIFFATDDNYIPYLAVTLNSIKEKANKNYNYKLYVLCEKVLKENKKAIKKYEDKNFKIKFINILKHINKVKKTSNFALRDYYTLSTYYRLFIPNLFSKFDKAIYLDCDIVLNEDISKLYNINLEENYVGAIPDMSVGLIKEFQNYVEKRIGMKSYKEYFNAGVLLMNLKKLREINFQDKFLCLMNQVKFDVAQDQDYLNAICKGHVKLIETGWNVMPLPGTEMKEKDIKLIHYNLSYKPWKTEVLYENHFWENAKKTEFYNFILNYKNNYDISLQEKSAAETLNLIELTKIQAEETNENAKIAKILKNIMNDETFEKIKTDKSFLEELELDLNKTFIKINA